MGTMRGSMRYTTSGRRRQKLNHGRKPRTNFPFKELGKPVEHRDEEVEYKSHDSTASIALKEDNSEKLEVSSKYTIAPAYNKGAYQVIPLDSIKDIGK